MAIGILYSEGLKEYDFGPGHPFRGDRYEIFPQVPEGEYAEDDNYRILKAEPATDDDLLLICQKDYIDFTREYYKAANLGLSYPGQFSDFTVGITCPSGNRENWKRQPDWLSGRPRWPAIWFKRANSRK